MPATSVDGERLDLPAYQAIFEYSLDGVLFTAPDGRVLAANPAACQLLGRSAQEICALGRQGLADPEDPRWVTGVAERARTGRTRTQVRMLRGDGTAFEADLSSATFDTPEGERRACVIFRDLSRRLEAARQVALADDRDRIARNLHDTVVRRLSAASLDAHALLGRLSDEGLRQRVLDLIETLDGTLVDVRHAVFRLGSEDERRYQNLVENSPVAVVVYRGTDGRFRYANQAAVDLFGARDLEDVLARRVVDVMPPQAAAGWPERVQGLLHGSVIRDQEALVQRLDGRTVPVQASAVRIAFDGEPAVQVEMHSVRR